MRLRTLGLLGIFAAHALACAGPRSSSTTTSAQKYAAGSPDLRTVDNTGYVDPGGRTGQVSAGGASTVGRGNAVPPPRRESANGRENSEATEDGAGTAGPVVASASSDPIELTERAARALCDRETYCDRIGAGKAFESADACMAAKRERVTLALREASCREIRGEQVASCLTAIRASSCGPPAASLQPPPACTGSTLCR